MTLDCGIANSADETMQKPSEFGKEPSNVTTAAYSAGRRLAAFWRRQPRTDRMGVTVVIFVALAFIPLAIQDARQQNEFNHLNPAQHFDQALNACGVATVQKVLTCKDPASASRHLAAIRDDSAESHDAATMKSALAAQTAELEKALRAQAYQRYSDNIAGIRSDPYQCSWSTADSPIISFDSGTNWWNDDGRCGLRLQKRRDEDAASSSYISTTLRVDTDMNASWLPDEQRTCSSLPGRDRKVVQVSCDSDAKPIHNIPIKFWGGTERGTVSTWRCTRNKSLLDDEFVCRAID